MAENNYNRRLYFWANAKDAKTKRNGPKNNANRK